ncbi:hypothetical protein NM208_g1424 [Fusarium decemcellulare]|uniref:Uncharacterized protein n=1 Tax=Fusarium decemcellulare TaxID=57161 RepID=A0ACC1SWC9_9HYPO|nr:hypothetical protein NM208_g1424 [Fusarium decemcellulare]
MQFKNIISLLASISVAQAYVIPEGLQDGIYAVDKDENGNEHIEFVSEFDDSAKTRMRRVPLPKGESGCSGEGLDYSDLSSAQVQLYNYCGAGAALTSKIMVFTHGNVKAYVCNYGGDNTCADHEAKAAFGSLSGTCGNPSSPLGGWYWLSDWAKTYGYDAAGADICTNM